MSRLLILGASTLQLPAILKAKEMGHYVAVADYNPQAIGILFADEFLKNCYGWVFIDKGTLLEYSTYDENVKIAFF